MNESRSYTIDDKYLNKTRYERFSKNHFREVLSCRDTLEEALSFLNRGLELGSFCPSAIRSEKKGLWRVAPKGCRRGRAEIRLYFYFCKVGKTLYPLTVGDKSSQKKDINQCKARIEKLFH